MKVIVYFILLWLSLNVNAKHIFFTSLKYRVSIYGFCVGNAEYMVTEIEPNYYKVLAKNNTMIYAYQQSSYFIYKDLIKTHHYIDQNAIRYDFYWRNNQVLVVSPHNKLQSLTSIYDPLTQLLQFQNDLLLKKKNYHYDVVYKKDLRHYSYKYITTEEINSKFGKITTLKFLQTSTLSSRTALLWVAPMLDNAIVKIQQWKKNKPFINLELVECKKNGKV